MTGGSAVAAGAYAGAVPADLLFGGPALSDAGGSILLRDARGHVADALNFGLLVDPWLSEGYQADSGENEPGNFVTTPAGRRNAFMPVAASALSAGRYPDGADLDDNKNDFRVQRSFSVVAPAATGENNIKLLSVQGITPGSSLVIGRGADAVVVQVAEAGSPGATALSAPARPGARSVDVLSAQGFVPGQVVLVGAEMAEVAQVIMPRGWRLTPGQVNQLVLKAPLRQAHKATEAVCGTGVTLTAPLKAAVAAGAPAASAQPTPGAPNQY